MLLIRLGLNFFFTVVLFQYIYAKHAKKRYNSVTYVSFKDGGLINLFIIFKDCPFVN
jgi:hypothetical protein